MHTIVEKVYERLRKTSKIRHIDPKGSFDHH